ncbi:hypothetical protein TNCV_4985502 [Trichonephila clavipes]|nr:hypothetical protein TNCV_4985502 [Trichonephila clavipes]
MANLPTDMELELESTQRTLSRTPSPQPQLTPCEQLKFNRAQLAKIEAFRKCKQACVDTLKQMPDHYPDEPFYQRALTELQDIEATMAVALSDIDSYDPCTIPGCPHHEITLLNSPIKFNQTIPKINSQTVNPCKRKDNSNVEYPPQRKTVRKIILDIHVKEREEINLSPNKFQLPKSNSKNLKNPGSPAIEIKSTPPGTENENTEANNSTNQSTAKNQLPPPIMLFIEEDVNYKDQMAVITKEFPKIRSRLTGDFLKLYTDTPEERTAVQFLRERKFQFYTIKSKAERSIKVVINGLPRSPKPEEIKEDLEPLGYTPERVNQVVGRKTKRVLPIFLITLPINLDNFKIFDLKTLSYLSIRVEGYNEHKISEFTEAVIETHCHASRPIETDRRNFTPQHINRLLKLKNHLRKQYHQTLNPIFKTQYNRAQSDFKKELKKHNDSTWQKRLESLNTTDNSLWRTQKFFKNKRPKIPPLNCATGTAVTDQQKANLLATNIKNNFIENDRENDSYNQSEEIINSTVDNFLSTPPTTLIQPALPDEIIHYIKHVNAKKAPGQPIGVTVHSTQQPIREHLHSSKPRQKLLKIFHPDEAQKPRLPDPIVQPIAVMPLSRT